MEPFVIDRLAGTGLLAMLAVSYTVKRQRDYWHAIGYILGVPLRAVARMLKRR